MPVGNNSSIDKVVDAVPELITKVNEAIRTRTVTKKTVESTEDANMVENEKIND
jgi:uncharacterized spore protein YtfJ